MATITKKPLHESILDRMERKARNILLSSIDEKEMLELGDILAESFLPKDKIPEIVKKIRTIAEEHLVPFGDEKSAYEYLSRLAELIEKG